MVDFCKSEEWDYDFGEGECQKSVVGWQTLESWIVNQRHQCWAGSPFEVDALEENDANIEEFKFGVGKTFEEKTVHLNKQRNAGYAEQKDGSESIPDFIQNEEDVNDVVKKQIEPLTNWIINRSKSGHYKQKGALL